MALKKNKVKFGLNKVHWAKMKRLTATKRSSPISIISKAVCGMLRILLGLSIYSFCVYLTIYANIGLAPWDCLDMGIAKHTPLNY